MRSSVIKLSIYYLYFVPGAYDQRSRTKRPRAPVAPQEILEPEQNLDERNNDLQHPLPPPGFLSPSVLEYLELGKSIPGKNSDTILFPSEHQLVILIPIYA